MVATVGAMVSFEEGSQLLEELAGVRIDAKQVERAAEALGDEIAVEEKHEVEAPGAFPLPEVFYLGIDGTGIPMRATELQGRCGKQPDGSAKTRRVKLCTVWSADSRDTDDAPAAFTQRVLREAMRRRFTAAERTVALGDGAPWIWKIARELFPRAIQIVDRFHVKQHLSDVATAIYGPESTQAHEWAQRCHEELDSCRLSGRFQDFWERRNDRRRAV